MKKIMVLGVILIIFMLSFSVMSELTYIDPNKLLVPGKCISKANLEGLWDAVINAPNALDSSGKQRTGFFKGDLVVETDSFGDYFLFSGKQGSYIEVSPPDLDLTGSFTIEGWVWDHYPAENNRWKIIVGKYDLVPYSLVLEGDNTLSGSAYIKGARQKLWDSGNPLPMSKWVHVAFTYNLNTLNPNAIATMYINGVQTKQSTTLLKGILDQNDKSLRFGFGYDASGPAPWKGKMDEMAIWSRALSASEIQNIYNCPGTKKALKEPSITPPPPCQKTTCLLYGANCGALNDGCGQTLNCGICPQGQSCINNLCKVTPPPCQQITCQLYGANCGALDDGCGLTLNCGTCSQGQSCINNLCVLSSPEPTPPPPSPPPCQQITCQLYGANCGVIDDGCGGKLDCGFCPSREQSCNNNLCVLSSPETTPPPPPPETTPDTKEPCQQITCLYGANCGVMGDGCGGKLNCGDCSPEQFCNNNLCEVLLSSPPETTPWDTFTSQDKTLCNAVVNAPQHDKDVLQQISSALGNASFNKLQKLASIVNAVKAWLVAA